MTTLFISDLHLDPSRPAVTRAFLQLLDEQSGAIDALYILGDFFEAWIGDDDNSELNQVVIGALQALSDRGVQLYIMHGNRDFLLGDAFAAQSGATLLADPCVIELYGRKILLMHGDSLCTGDREYIAFRNQVRDPAWQQALLAKPLAERKAIADQMRNASRDANSNKASAIMDVTTADVEKALENAGTDLLIHGHTHRPAIHNNQYTRIVLGDWGEKAWVLRYPKNGEFVLESVAIGD